MKKEFCFCFLSFFLFHLFSFCSTTTTTTTTTTTKQQRPVQRLSLGRRRPESRRTRGFGFGRTSRLCQQRPLAVAFVVVVVGMLLSGRRVCTCFGRKEPVSDEQQQQHRAPLFFVRDKCNSVGPESTSATAAAAAARRRRRRRPGRSRLGPRCLLRRGFPLSLVR